MCWDDSAEMLSSNAVQMRTTTNSRVVIIFHQKRRTIICDSIAFYTVNSGPNRAVDLSHKIFSHVTVTKINLIIFNRMQVMLSVATIKFFSVSYNSPANLYHYSSMHAVYAGVPKMHFCNHNCQEICVTLR